MAALCERGTEDHTNTVAANYCPTILGATINRNLALNIITLHILLSRLLPRAYLGYNPKTSSVRTANISTKDKVFKGGCLLPRKPKVPRRSPSTTKALQQNILLSQDPSPLVGIKVIVNYCRF